MTDANWAACPVTRKSTSSTFLQFGLHPIYTASSTQTIISLSSGESDFYAAVRAACRGLGLRAMLHDLKLEKDLDLVTDSTAAKGMASRRGAAKVRHIHCPAMWLQQAVARKRLRIVKRNGKVLAADVGTKTGHIAEKVGELLAPFGVVRVSGKASAQLDAAGT